MDISYIGHSSFIIKNRDCRIVTDPFDPNIGLKFPKTLADIVTISHHHSDHDNYAGMDGQPMMFDWPGEFEKKGVRVFGYQSFHDDSKGSERGENVIYKFEIDDIDIVHLGDLGHLPEDKLTDAVGDVDVLFVPVGGFFTIDAKQAAQTIKKFDPAIVIPMHYQQEKLVPEIKEKLAPLSDFLKVMGAESVQPLDKFSLKKEEIGDREHEVVVLNPSA